MHLLQRLSIPSISHRSDYYFIIIFYFEKEISQRQKLVILNTIQNPSSSFQLCFTNRKQKVFLLQALILQGCNSIAILVLQHSNDSKRPLNEPEISLNPPLKIFVGTWEYSQKYSWKSTACNWKDSSQRDFQRQKEYQFAYTLLSSRCVSSVRIFCSYVRVRGSDKTRTQSQTTVILPAPKLPTINIQGEPFKSSKCNGRLRVMARLFLETGTNFANVAT